MRPLAFQWSVGVRVIERFCILKVVAISGSPSCCSNRDHGENEIVSRSCLQLTRGWLLGAGDGQA